MSTLPKPTTIFVATSTRPDVSSTPHNSTLASGRPLVSSLVALTLLETIRAQDRPEEILQDEDPTITMPRRLGLSDVIHTQIRRYSEEVRRRQRVSESEIGDLFRLVVRRPDARRVFFLVGQELSERDRRRQRGARLKSRIGRLLARRRVKKRLKTLFGRRVGTFGHGPFCLEGSDLLFAREVSGGEACELVSGLCHGILEGHKHDSVTVVHETCQGRGDEQCRWTVSTARTGSSDDDGAEVATDG